MYQNSKKRGKRRFSPPADHNGETVQLLGVGGLLLIITGVIFGILIG